MTAAGSASAMGSLDPRLPQRLAHLIESQLHQGLSRGMQVYVSSQGSPVVDRGFGLRAQDDEPVTTDTRFAAFSASKPLTATALHLLVEQGLLAYHDPVVRFLPQFGLHGKGGVTLRHLLLHQAGISDPVGTVPIQAFADFEDAIERICRLEPDTAPGQETTYHPLTGMAVVAAVVQRVAGESFREFCERHVFSPLGMVRTTFGLPAAVAHEVTDTVGVVPERVEVCTTWASPAARASLHPAIGAHTTARDLGAFYEAWLAALRGNGGLVSKATARLATSVQARTAGTAGFGYGFIVGCDPASPSSRGSLCSEATFGHPGMCSTQSYADPGSGLVVVLLANGDPGQEASDRRFAILCDEIGRAITS